MLIVSRSPAESIIITTEDGTRITVTQLSIKGNQSRIGIDAPKTITVHREEIQQRIDAENAENNTDQAA